MRFLRCAIIGFILFSSMAQADEGKIDYQYVSNKAPAASALVYQGSILTIGASQHLLFNKDIQIVGRQSGPLDAKTSGTLDIKDYIRFAKVLRDDSLVFAGIRHDKTPSLFNDPRSVFIAVTKSGSFSISKEKVFSEAAPLSLNILPDGTFVLLVQGSDGHFRLSHLDKELHVLDDIKFGGGPHTQSGSLALLNNGNYGVLGFMAPEEGKEVVPTYWEITSDFKLVEEKPLSLQAKFAGNGSDFVSLVSHEEDLYAAYGWQIGNPKDNTPNEISVIKLKGNSLWEKPIMLAHYPGMRMFISDNGPYILYPKVDYLEKITLSPLTGEAHFENLNRPIEPVECFPPKKKYDIVDVLQWPSDSDMIVLSNTPLGNPMAGCVTIGQMR